MKAKFLKMAGAKNEQEFYDMFPTKESFVAKYGKELRKDPEIPKAFWGQVIQALPAIASAIGSMKKSGGEGKGEEVEEAEETGIQSSTSFLNKAPGMVGTAFKIKDAFKAQKEALNQARQIHQVTDAALMAQQSDNSREEEARQRQQYQVTPWDNIISPDHRMPSYGVGTNVLAKYGTEMKAQQGGKFSNSGVGKFLQSDNFTNFANSTVNSWTNNSAGAQVGNVAGDIAGKIPGLGPVAKKFASPVLKAAGHLIFSQGDINRTKKELRGAEQDINTMAGMNFGQFMQNKNAPYMQDGGIVEKSPQKIFTPPANFGIHPISYGMLNDKIPAKKTSVEDYKESWLTRQLRNRVTNAWNSMDMTPIEAGNARRERVKNRKEKSKELQTGGSVSSDIHVGEGGNNQLLSYNPFAPGDGKTGILKGDSHKNGGIMLQYGGNMVEAENDEPLVKMDESTMAVMGRLDVPKALKKSAETTVGEKLSGNKFNTIVKSIGEKETEANQDIKRNIEKGESLTPLNNLDRITAQTLNLNIENIAKPKLAALQDAKEAMAVAQDSINETAEEMNLEADQLALGKIKVRKDRRKKMAQFGATNYMGTAQGSFRPQSKNEEEFYGDVKKEDFNSFVDRHSDWFNFDQFDPSNKEDVKRLQKRYNELTPGNKVKVDGLFGEQTLSMMLDTPLKGKVGPAMPVDVEGIMNYVPPTFEAPKPEGKDKKKKKSKIDWTAYMNMIPQLFDDSDAEGFDNRQLIPEMYAMSTNQLEAVDAQKFRPRLDLPYDISYQEALNRNRANARSAERMAAYNPGLLANLKAKEYEADQNVLAQQFRANQAKKDAVYSSNRQILNEADKLNLQIMDTQYQRQAMAKSNTKATTQAALNSISNKLAKHRLENKTLKVWENMYDYRYGPNYRTNYIGDPLDVNNWMAGGGSGAQAPPGYEVSGYNKHGQPYFRPISKTNRNTSEEQQRQLEAEAARMAAGDPSLAGQSWNPQLGRMKNGGLVKKYKKFK